MRYFRYFYDFRMQFKKKYTKGKHANLKKQNKTKNALNAFCLFSFQKFDFHVNFFLF